MKRNAANFGDFLPPFSPLVPNDHTHVVGKGEETSFLPSLSPRDTKARDPERAANSFFFPVVRIGFLPSFLRKAIFAVKFKMNGSDFLEATKKRQRMGRKEEKEETALAEFFTN